jgi:hypothetical protein
VVVPRWAKSAATLFSLGAQSIILGEDGQLGPLDAQIFDADREENRTSALSEVGAVEALHEATTEAAVGALYYMRGATKKKLNVLMPYVLDFVAKLHQPLFVQIDAVRYSQKSRILDVAFQYATRLLFAHERYSEVDARNVAKELVRHYPSHSFVINREEAAQVGKRTGKIVGLQTEQPTDRMEEILDRLHKLLGGDVMAIGELERVKS